MLWDFLDEVGSLSIGAEVLALARMIDANGDVLDILVQTTLELVMPIQAAIKRFLQDLLAYRAIAQS